MVWIHLNKNEGTPGRVLKGRVLEKRRRRRGRITFIKQGGKDVSSRLFADQKVVGCIHR